MKKLLILLALAMSLGACATAEDPGVGQPSPSASETISTVEIEQCTTAQGDQAPTAPKGVDFKTQLNDPTTLLVGSDNDYPPFESIPAGKQEPEGFDVDIYKEVAKRMGLTAKSKTLDFDGLFTDSVPNGKVDVGISAITIKEERKRTVDFTVPYFVADLSLAVNATKTPDIKTIDDLSGLIVGAQEGTTGADCAKFLKDEGKVKDVKLFDDTGPAFQDLGAGRVAAVVNDRPASEGFIERNPDLKVVQVISTKEQYGFAVSKDKPDLRAEIDKHLTAMMEDGTYATIYEKWFETQPPFQVPLS